LLLASLLPLVGQPVAGEEKIAAGQAVKADPGASLMDSLSLTSRREPIHIRSRDLEFRYNEKLVTYRGGVVVTQGETTLKSDTLVVTYEDQPTEKGLVQAKTENTALPQRLKEIVAEGNVQITNGDRRATSKKAVFNEAARTVVLSGNAVLEEGGNRVTGEKVTVFLDEKRSTVEGGAGKQQVEMVISQQQEEGKKGVKTP
jgi:lipopolysaccharide export system protein LptA